MTTTFSVVFLRVTQDLREPLEIRVRKAREDPLVRLVPMGQLAAVAPE